MAAPTGYPEQPTNVETLSGSGIEILARYMRLEERGPALPGRSDPLSLNKGVTHSSPIDPPPQVFAAVPARFDWYAATVEMHPQILLKSLTEGLGDEPPRAMQKGLMQYARGVEIRSGGTRVARCRWDGVNPLPHVEATGENAPALADFLRGEGVEHRLSRVDVCVDVKDQGAIGPLVTAARAFDIERKRRRRMIHDPDDPSEGLTYEVGSRKSEHYTRIYDKGAEQGTGADHARFELQHKPHGIARKWWCSMASPEQILGVSPLARAIGPMLSMHLEPAPARTRRLADDERAWIVHNQQWLPLMRRRLADHHGGDLEAFLSEISGLLNAEVER